MKKILILSGIVLLALIVGGWLFFSSGHSAQQPLSDAEQRVLTVKDKGLTKGDESAPVKIVEYADILCPYCAKVNEEVIPQI